MWVRAMYTYYHVSLSVEPKRIRLKGAEEELSETMEVLNDAKARLKAVTDKLADLQERYDVSLAESERLQIQVKK